MKIIHGGEKMEAQHTTSQALQNIITETPTGYQLNLSRDEEAISLLQNSSITLYLDTVKVHVETSRDEVICLSNVPESCGAVKLRFGKEDGNLKLLYSDVPPPAACTLEEFLNKVRVQLNGRF